MKIVALMGEAGSGKDTILHSIMEKYPSYFNEIISCTTRPPREGEKEGVNYYFLSIDEFTKKVLNGDMLEATEFNDWHYGTDSPSHPYNNYRNTFDWSLRYPSAREA